MASCEILAVSGQTGQVTGAGQGGGLHGLQYEYSGLESLKLSILVKIRNK